METRVPQDWKLTGSDPFAADYHPTFTGNGYFAARIPAAGQGYSRDRVETQFQVAGLYAAGVPNQVRAGAPAWTGLTLSDESGSFDRAFEPDADPQHRGRVSDYRQTLDLATGAIETRAQWTAPGGAVYAVAYTVIIDRANDQRAVVRLTVTPHQDGAVTVSDVLDARAATFVDRFEAHHDADAGTIGLDTSLRGSGIVVSLASTLVGAGDRAGSDPDTITAPSVGQALVAHLHAGESRTFVKYVGLATSADGEDPASLAAAASAAAAVEGFDAVRAGNDRAWARLWTGDVRVTGDDVLQSQLRASRFYLLASATATRPWSLSPAGLSSDGYGGHVFWDTETWMWPSLVLQDPEIAAAVLQYRADRLDDAAHAAAAGGDQGIRFPWEGALDGAEHTPAIEFGETELHVISDVALACWQYYLATGDLEWLAGTGGPIICGAADFWVGRAVLGADGEFHIRHVTPPDEWAQAHDDSAYTNVAAAQTARFAIRTAELLGHAVSPAWGDLADRIFVPYDADREVTREHADYTGQRIKQADVVMLTYPWEYAQDAELTARNLDYYATKVTEHGGPSMTDAMHAIVSAELGRAGDAFWYTARSAAPFLRAPFHQFAEERDGGAFTFVTGAGGFLQEFSYGYTGLRLREDGIALNPLLPEQLEEITLTGMRYRGQCYRITVAREATTVTVTEGSGLAVHADGGVQVAAPGSPVSIPTRRSIDSGPDRGHGTRRGSVSALDSYEDPASRDFDVTRFEVFSDGALTRLVTTVAGEIANPEAGEGMSAQLLHVYLALPGHSDGGATACLPGLDAATAAPWRYAVIGNGLRQSGGGGTGLFDADGDRIADVRLIVSRRQQIVLSFPTAALGGVDPAECAFAVAMVDVAGSAAAQAGAGRLACVLRPAGTASREILDAPGGRVELPFVSLTPPAE